MKKRVVTAFTSAALLAGLIAGCTAPGDGGKGSSPGGTAPSPDEGSLAKKLRMVNYSSNFDKMNVNGFAYNLIKQKFNVDIELLPIPNDVNARKDAIFLKIASGEIPNTWSDLRFPDYNKLVREGAVAEIPEELLQKYAPKYMAWLKKHLGDDPFKYTRRDGKNYSMPIIWTLGPTQRVLGIRQDWLDKVGITKKPETLDELENALRKFRNDDPDGNGKKDTYGLTGRSDSLEQIFTSVFGAFGVYPGAFYEENGKIVRGDVQPGAKQALTVLNKWYTEDLLDPEFVLNKSTNVEDKVVSGKVGMVQDSWWRFLPREAFFSGLLHDKTKENNPNAKWTLLAGPKGPDGKQGMTQGNPIISSGVQFGKPLEKNRELMIRYIQIAEERSFNPQFYESLVYGEKGKTYRVTESGDFEYIPPYDKEEERIKFGIGEAYGTSFNDYDMQAPYATKSNLRQMRKDAEAVAKGKYDILAAVDMPEYFEVKDRLDQMTLKNYVDFIIGKRPVGQFDQFVDEWKKAGGAKTMEVAQREYDKTMKK
ncbi:extracellular solute-binding protein [Paenibacillus allorhizosphaerae]|uniref:Lipoprotein LipO n=1 Tax=Paenibacillus allorhizosphaerae TaxID=2849866 RepID=A0ABN7TFV6_9BACL|nr:extracellular solute-binding protein [Paenibacillus allorhizosphaerae]CAG7615478.1 Lipoprotein LipO [Paenibacillus allorhizosphaerae]